MSNDLLLGNAAIGGSVVAGPQSNDPNSGLASGGAVFVADGQSTIWTFSAGNLAESHAAGAVHNASRRCAVRDRKYENGREPGPVPRQPRAGSTATHHWAGLSPTTATGLPRAHRVSWGTRRWLGRMVLPTEAACSSRTIRACRNRQSPAMGLSRVPGGKASEEELRFQATPR